MSDKKLQYPRRYFTGKAIVSRPTHGRADARLLGILILLIALAVFLYNVSQ